jgi:hypothetical protein
MASFKDRHLGKRTRLPDFAEALDHCPLAGSISKLQSLQDQILAAILEFLKLFTKPEYPYSRHTLITACA